MSIRVAARIGEKEVLGLESGGECKEHGRGHMRVFFQVSMGVVAEECSPHWEGRDTAETRMH